MATHATRTERLVALLGGARNGVLTVGGVPVTHLADQAGTPFYVYSGDVVLRQVERTAAALGPHTTLYYSLKANPSLGVCQLMARHGLGAEVASDGELLVAQVAGVPARRTLFAGPGKTDQELALAVKLDIQAVNVESPGELDRLAAVAARLGRTARVALRLNPALPLKGAQMRMGGGPQQFGIDEERLHEALDIALRHPSLHVVGLHVYAGTQVFDADALLAHCRHTLELAQEVAARLGRPLELVDLGGGFGVPYVEGAPEFDLDAFAAGYRPLVAEARQDPILAPAQLVVELGRYLVAEAGLYVTRVVDVKRSRGRCFVVTDGGMNHHITATGNFGQVFRRPFPLALVDRMDAPPQESVTIVGPCCTPLDVIAQEARLPRVQVGDLLGVFASGAYGYSASSLAFLGHPTPAELMVWEGATYVLREPGRPDQALDGQWGLGRPSSPRPAQSPAPQRAPGSPA